jgi:cytochrome b involved in lipid metabolism
VGQGAILEHDDDDAFNGWQDGHHSPHSENAWVEA